MTTSLSTTLGALLLSCVSGCGRGEAAVDWFALYQQGDYAGAVALLGPQLENVDQGTEEHKELLLAYTAALAVSSP